MDPTFFSLRFAEKGVGTHTRITVAEPAATAKGAVCSKRTVSCVRSSLTMRGGPRGQK